MRENKSNSKKSKLPLYLSGAIFLAVVCSYFFIPSVQQFCKEAWHVLLSEDKDATQQWVKQFGFWGPSIIVLCMIVQMFLIVIPSPLLMVVAVLAYGKIWGSLIVFFSVFVASSIGYAIGFNFGAPLIQRLIGEKTESKITNFVESYGFWAVIVTRVSPFLSNDAISFVGGIIRMGYWKFIGSTLIGIAPLTFLIAYLGDNTDRLKTGLIWGSAVSLLLFCIYVWWDKHRKANS